MNKLDEIGRKQGYWEKENENELWKGNYINGLEEGLWKGYHQSNLIKKVLYKSGNWVKLKALQNNFIFYVENKVYGTVTVHKEEYE